MAEFKPFTIERPWEIPTVDSQQSFDRESAQSETGEEQALKSQEPFGVLAYREW